MDTNKTVDVVDGEKLVNHDSKLHLVDSTDLVRTSDLLEQVTKGVITEVAISSMWGTDIVRLHYNRLAFYGGLVTTGVAATAASVVASMQFLPNFGADDIGIWSATLSIMPAMGTMIVSALGLPLLASKMVKKADLKLLNKSMNSNDPAKHAYYVNRMLYVLIMEKPKETALFDNAHTLAYASWLGEIVSQLLQASSNNKKVRKFFKEAAFGDFVKDKHFDVYVAVAEEMISGVLSKGRIPLTDGNAEGRKILRKAKDIINDREYWRSDYTNRFEEDARMAIEMLGSGSFTPQDSNAGSVQNSYLDDVQALKDIESEWLDIQSDILQILKFPMLADIREPLVQSFYTKLSVAKSLMGRVAVNDFVVAISDLKVAWSLLMHEAQRIELSKFDEGERKKILMATNLMNIALNTASTPAERQSAYKKAMEQLKGLVVLPKAALAVLEESVSRKEILELKSA